MRRIAWIGLIVILLAACTSVGNDITNEDYSLIVEMPVDKYAPTMSSVPGLPLEITSKLIREDIELKMHFSCTKGTFLNWESKVTDEGDTVFKSFENLTLYWSPLWDEDVIEDDVEILIDVLQASDGTYVESRSYTIHYEDGYYTIY